MAQKVTVELVDDVDGTAAIETVSFALDGVEYEIDLSKSNASKLRKDISKWTEPARRVRGTRRRRGTRPADPSETSMIREWAKENGVQVSDRGRISAEVREAYLKAQGQS